MNSSHDWEGMSLLQLVTKHQQGGDDHSSLCIDVLKWLDRAALNEAKAAFREINDDGETALHLLLKNNQAFDSESESPSITFTERFTASQAREPSSNLLPVVEKFSEIDRDAFKIKDGFGRLPLHNACQDRSCRFDVIQAVIQAYPDGLGVMSNKKKSLMSLTPFDWDHATSVGAHLTDFLHYVVASDISSSAVEKNTMETRGARERLLGHCKNWIPLDILKKGMLNKRTLESNAMARWLNEMPCKRTVVCSMVFEFYLHVAWIGTFVSTTYWHMEDELSLHGWAPIALLVFSALFFIQEFNQMYRFFKTNSIFAYWLDFWNWVDLTTSSLVAVSAIKFLLNDKSIHNDYLLITTGFFQLVLIISYLKKTFFAFSKFVNGVIKIFWSLMPFLVISVITIFAFAFMYYVREKDLVSYDPSPHESPNPYGNLWESFKTVYSPFAGGPLGESENILDFMFGIAIIIILLNVVIAVVSQAWEDATEEANEAFWNYRLDLILEKTRGVNEDRFFETIFCNYFGGLDELFINSNTVGTTTEELKQKVALTYREKGVFFCLLVIVKSLGFIVLGFPTFGILWPEFFRQMLFTPPRPMEDETIAQISQIVAEMDECKSAITECRGEVELLSDRVKVQIELMKQILSKDERDTHLGQITYHQTG